MFSASLTQRRGCSGAPTSNALGTTPTCSLAAHHTISFELQRHTKDVTRHIVRIVAMVLCSHTSLTPSHHWSDLRTSTESFVTNNRRRSSKMLCVAQRKLYTLDIVRGHLGLAWFWRRNTSSVFVLTVAFEWFAFAYWVLLVLFRLVDCLFFLRLNYKMETLNSLYAHKC